MTTTNLIIHNFQEIRRRSEIVWNAIPAEFYNWKPDETAMPMIAMVRHVLEGEAWFHDLVLNRGGGKYISPWANLPYSNIADEISFAEPHRNSFFETIKAFAESDLETIEIVRAEKNQRRKLGDYLMRIAYHEAVHAGQLLDYMRTAGIERPNIWD
jgi:uncharacterized damage-inducible protein DinB